MVVFLLALIVSVAANVTKFGCLLNYENIPYDVVHTEQPYGAYLRSIGSGTTGSVSLFENSGHPVAIKVFADAVHQMNNSVCIIDPRQEREVKLEYMIGTLLNDVPGVARTIDLLYNATTCRWGVAIEYVPNSLVRMRRHLKSEERVRVISRIASMLEEIHRLGISHGDLKLENVLLTDEMEPQLIDFGTATFSNCPVESTVRNGSVVSNVVPGDYGTVAYLPPEIFHQLEYDRPKADIWALGILSLVLFNGRAPWSVAAEDDADWRRFIGWERVTEDQCCLTTAYHTRYQPKWPICSSSKHSLLVDIPELLRDSLDRWLEVDVSSRALRSLDSNIGHA